MSAKKAPAPRTRPAAPRTGGERGARREHPAPVKAAKAGKGAQAASGHRERSPARRQGLSPEGISEAILWVLFLLVPLLVVPTAKEAFRLPKLLAAEWLGLASLLPLAWKLRGIERLDRADLRRPVLVATLPLVLIATLGLFVTRHPQHVREALTDLWIGAACLAGWTLGLPRARLERLLGALLIPASVLAFIGIAQFHGLWRPWAFLGLAPGERLAVTSTAGNPGDLAAYLVLPCLVAQWILARGARSARGAPGAWGPPRRVLAVAALALCLYALALTQTLAAVLAVGAGSLVLWLALLPRRRALLALGAATAAALLLAVAVPPLRVRVGQKARQVAAGDWHQVLTGRLDGWRAAGWMFSHNPVTGVGHGAFRAEFVPAKIALLDEGKAFYPGHADVVFANAHNELLEVAADLGLPGLAALGWGLGALAGALARRAREGRKEAALAWGGATALALLCLAHFPFRIALVAYPALLFLAWTMHTTHTMHPMQTPRGREEPA